MKISWIRILRIWPKEITIKMKNKNPRMKINGKKTIKWPKRTNQKTRARKTPTRMRRRAKTSV
jgi:hypothetical protein